MSQEKCDRQRRGLGGVEGKRVALCGDGVDGALELTSSDAGLGSPADRDWRINVGPARAELGAA